jgi:hypothetical protein
MDMKNSFTKKMKMLVVLLAVMTTNVWAQLNGVYTIDLTQPTAGTNFQTFSAFANTINAQGVSGPVTVNVAVGTGPYVEQPIFNQITGMSVTNSVTINGSGVTITFAGTAAAPHTMLFNGTDYFTVNNLNMVGTTLNSCLVLHLYNLADNNRFNNCTFTTPQNNTTQSGAVPVSVSGSANSATSAGPGGNNNAWTTCTMTSGWANVSFYTNTSAPINTLNVVRSCYLNDAYQAGIYCYYQNDDIFANNVIEQNLRTSVTTFYGVWINGICLRTKIDGNHVRKMFNANQAYTGTGVGIYNTCTSVTAGNENHIMNNIISDNKFAGPLYGVYMPSASYNNTNIYNNTIAHDDQSTGTGSATYGIFVQGGPNMIKNNIITISRTGTGTKYGIYATTNATLSINRNVILMNAPGGVNNTGFWNGLAYQTLANWQTAAGNAYDQQGSNVNPNYLNVAIMNYSPTALAINNMAEPLNLVNDFNLANRSLATPDPGAIEFFTAPCFGIPAANSVTAPAFVYCPNTPVNISVINTYSNAGYTYQWQSSTSTALGPWTTVSGGTLSTLTTPGNVGVTTFYSAIITCATGGTVLAVAGTVSMAVTTTSTVPYYESFENLAPNKLPNCSWSVSNAASAVTQTISGANGSIPLTGTNFARFNVTSGSNSFYTNGIFLNAGVTYSASMWWLTEGLGYANWTQLAILVGPNQSAVGQQTIVNTPGAAISPVHKSLSGTFQVATSGLYYVQVRATSIAGSAPFLSWDDLRIEIPCSLNGPNMTINANSFTQCDGQPFNINAMGADSYTWSNGQQGAYASIMPNIANPVIYVTGTKTLSGCPATKAITLTVNPSPIVFANAFPTEVCAGSQVNLSANGNNVVSFNWSNGAQGQVTTANPTTSGSYSVFGTNSYGCATMASILINVNPLPNIIAQASNTNICAGDALQLLGTNGVTYQWLSNTAISYIGNPLNINPTASSIFTLTGTDDKGCQGKTTFVISVDICTGLKQNGSQVSGVQLYPNPNNGSFTIESAGKGEKTMEVTDISGRLILSGVIAGEKTEVNITTLANGVYYVKLRSEGAVETIKVVKNN